MKKKHYYIKLDNVSSEFEKQYNKIVRKEEYLLEKDPIGNAVFFGNEDELYKHKIVDYITAKENDKIESQRCKEYLRNALAELKIKYPLEYSILESYYLSDKRMNTIEIAKSRNISKQAVSKLLCKAKKHLKSLVLYYRNNC